MSITCASAAHTNRPGACGSIATKLLAITFAERRHPALGDVRPARRRVHEDLADPLLAYLRHTSATETPIHPTDSPDRQGEA